MKVLAGLERVVVVGAGKVGRALASALRARGVEVVVVRGRAVARRRDFAADLLVLAVADPFVEPTARAIVERIASGRRGAAGAPRAAVHVAGALDVDAIAAFRSVNVPVAQMHPLLSFAGGAVSFVGATMRVAGDRAAALFARRAARVLGMIPRALEGVPAPAYHAAAALAANGAVALALAASDLLGRHGVERTEATAMLGPLMASVAANLAALGLPAALTGPVRRGDHRAVERHLAALGSASALYRAVVAVQLEIAAEIGEAEPGSLDRIRALVAVPK